MLRGLRVVAFRVYGFRGGMSFSLWKKRNPISTNMSPPAGEKVQNIHSAVVKARVDSPELS